MNVKGMATVRDLTRRSRARHRGRCAATAVLLGLVLAIAGPVGPAGAMIGGLDPTFFGSAGKGLFAHTGFLSTPAIAVQPDGRTVSGGTFEVPGEWAGGTDFHLLRLDPDGTVDESFGARTDFDNRYDDLSDIALDPRREGGIVAVGGSFPGDGAWDMAVARYHATGALDWQKRVNFGPLDTSETAKAVAVQPDGKIVIVGSIRTLSSGEETAIVRLNPDGSFDSTFDGDGKRTVLSEEDDLPVQRGTAVAIDPTTAPPSIIVAGQAEDASFSSHFLIMRLLADGSLDPGFSGAGSRLVRFDRSSRANDLAVQPDGRVVLVGDEYGSPRPQSEPRKGIDSTVKGGDFTSNPRFAIARLTPEGWLDRSFNRDGKDTIRMGDSSGANAVVLTSEHAWVVGRADGSGRRGSDLAVARIQLSDGSSTERQYEDMTYSGGTEYNADAGHDVAVVPDTAPWWIRGKVTVATKSQSSGGGVIRGAVRYLTGRSGGCTHTSTRKATTLVGTDGNDILCARTPLQTPHVGDPTSTTRLVGREGDDILVGGSGIDNMYGGPGADVLLGWDGRDALEGGPGDDELRGSYSDDLLNGGPEADVLAGGPDLDPSPGRDGDRCMVDPEDVVISCS